MMPRLLLPLCAAASLGAGALSAQSASVPESVQQLHVHFLQAFNAGDEPTLRRFVATYFRQQTGAQIERAVGFWGALRAEVGPLAPLGYRTERRGNREAIIRWYQGTTTGAYPGIELALDSGETPRVGFYGVNRAVRPTVAPVPTAAAASARRDALGAYFRRVADSGHFSGVVVVMERGRVIFEGAYGKADAASGRLNTLDTPFRLASVAKLFAGVAIMQLVDRGLVSLDDPIARFIPEYPRAVGESVTVRHLLTHTSGIELDGDSLFVARVGQARSIADLLAAQVERVPHIAAYAGTVYRPPNRFDYTNEGIDLLGVIVERASGQRWGAYLTDHVFRPAGMRRAGSDFLSPVPDIALGYTLREVGSGQGRGPERELAPVTGGALAAIRPAGAGYATAADMIRFFDALTNGTLLREATARAMMSRQVEVPAPPGASLPCTRGYGFTMSLTTCANGALGVGHTGGAYGQSTVIEHFPESGITVAILSNYDRVTWWAHLHALEILGLR